MEDDLEEDTVALPSFTTPRGNTLTMEAHSPYGFYKIKYTDGGELPDVLKGNYTAVSNAVTAIKNYIQHIPPLRPKGEPAKVKTAKGTKTTATKAAKKQEKVEVGENLSS